MKFAYAFLFCFSILFFNACAPSLKQMPNVVILLADDLGYGDLGCYGCPDIKTPHIDKLAEQGVRLTNFYANGPECTPTRTALLTGRYQQRVGGLECAIGTGNVGRYDEAIWLSDQKELGLPAEECTMPFSFQKAGYNTAITGKWHLGYEKKFRPNNNGFDYSIGPIGYGGDYFYHNEQADINQDDFKESHNLAENGKEIFRDGEYMTGLLTKEAIKYIDQQSDDKPFLLYLPFTSPHSPFQGPNDDIGRPLQSREEWRFQSREKFIEMVEAMDEGIGEVLSALDNKNLSRETIVIFFSDNGGAEMANNGILSGIKGQVYEGGIRVPCIIRWPGNIAKNSVSEQSSISFDLTYSILNLIGDAENDTELDGYDIIDHIVQNVNDIDRTLFWRLKRGAIVRRAIRDGDYKYLIVFDGDSKVDEKLFNITDDPSESFDLLTHEPEKTKSLQEKLHEWEEEVKAPRLKSFENN